jgi:hypothetical protein
MIEELYATLNHKVEKEVFKQTVDIRQSPFNDQRVNDP